MRPVSASIAIDAPRERVFDLLCDLAIRPAFTDHFMTDYRLERVDPVGVGAGARFRLRGSGAWLDTVIEEVERPHLIREQGRGGRSNRVPVFTVWELVEGAWPEGCDASITFWSETELAVDKARELLGGSRQFRRDWKRALARLKQIVEAEEPVQRVAVAGADRLPALID
jgi:uncharacterized protein YndB with AHSA1/START domain